MNPIVKNIAIFLLVLVGIGSFFSLYNTSSFQKAEKVSLETIVQQVQKEQVKSIEVKGDTLQITLSDDKRETAKKESMESLSTLLKNYGVDAEKMKKVRIEVKDQTGAFWMGTLMTIFLPFLVLGLFVYLMFRQVQGVNNRAMTFGLSRAQQVDSQNVKDKVTFSDVAGATEAKEELQEVVEFLKDQKKFLDLGAKIPKGVLLVGPPGTGKTLLAKAVAGEAGVPFFQVSGSEFIEMFVGVGASRVRDLFQRAKRQSPCIIFVDEIDAVGRQRGTGLGGSHDEREQTLNQILVELDGFEQATNVIVLAATNRPDVLDPALLRPGRFDRRIFIDLPSILDREGILGVHARNKPLSEGVSLRKVAERTPGFSGADLANLMNEAAILAARKGQVSIFLQDVFDSIEKVMLGPERKTFIISEKEKKITAYHEAGHALISHVLPEAPPVQKISVIARGRAGGYTMNLPTEDKHYHSRSEFEAELAVLMGGYAAEKTIFNDVTTGASNDLKKATDLARRIVTEFGMSEKLGQRTFGGRDDMVFLGRDIAEHRDYCEKTAELIDQEISFFLSQAYQKAIDTIVHSREKLEAIVQLLLEKETLEREEFEALFA